MIALDDGIDRYPKEQKKFKAKSIRISSFRTLKSQGFSISPLKKSKIMGTAPESGQPQGKSCLVLLDEDSLQLEASDAEPKPPKAPADIVLRDSHGCKVQRTGGTIVKSGPAVEPAEATALELIARRLDIPVPRLHSTSTCLDGTTRISMDHVDGDNLSDLWTSLSNDRKLTIAEQLRAIVVAMRSLQPEHKTTVGSCGGGPTVEIRRYGIYKAGPFADAVHSTGI